MIIKTKCKLCGEEAYYNDSRKHKSENCFCSHYCTAVFYKGDMDDDYADKFLELCEKYKLKEWADGLNYIIRAIVERDTEKNNEIRLSISLDDSELI